MSDTRPSTAVVSFGLPEHTVDDLLQGVAEAGLPRGRWLVAGQNMHLLGALNVHWSQAMEVVLIHAPHAGLSMREVMLDIAAAEGCDDTEQLIWLHGPLATCEPPVACTRVLDGRLLGTPALTRRLVRELQQLQ